MKLYEIGQKIKLLRKDKNLTQEELATKCGVSRVTLGKLERGEFGNVSVRTLDVILANLEYEIEFQRVSCFGLPSLDEIG